MSDNIFSFDPEDVKRLVERNEVPVCVAGVGEIRLSTTLMHARSSLMAVGISIDDGLA